MLSCVIPLMLPYFYISNWWDLYIADGSLCRHGKTCGELSRQSWRREETCTDIEGVV